MAQSLPVLAGVASKAVCQDDNILVSATYRHANQLRRELKGLVSSILSKARVAGLQLGRSDHERAAILAFRKGEHELAAEPRKRRAHALARPLEGI